MNLRTAELVTSLYNLAVWSEGDRTKFNGALQDVIYNVLLRRYYNTDFNEADHPRDKDGKFIEKGKGGVTTKSPKSTYTESFKQVGRYSGDKKEYYKQIEAWYKNNLSGKNIINKLLGKISFTNKEINETLSKNRFTPENLKYFPAVVEIIKNSQNITREELKHNNKPGVLYAYKIKERILEENGKTRKIKIIILKYSDKLVYYTFDARG